MRSWHASEVNKQLTCKKHTLPNCDCVFRISSSELEMYLFSMWAPLQRLYLFFKWGPWKNRNFGSDQELLDFQFILEKNKFMIQI